MAKNTPGGPPFDDMAASTAELKESAVRAQHLRNADFTLLTGTARPIAPDRVGAL